MKGTYCLIISMKKSEKLDIGHLIMTINLRKDTMFTLVRQ